MATRKAPPAAGAAKQRINNNILEERKIIGAEDMVMLSDISDKGVVANLTTRLQASEIYSYIGNVLVICNPYKWLKIYENDTIQKYPFCQQADVGPHIFFNAESAYRGMIQNEENQCIIVSGESGAGKTEASKHIQSYIAAVCGGGKEVDKIKEVFLQSNPVLEAFGNAKTLRNNNSSRFGKYFELKFDRVGNPKGGVITNYLLEKSRIVKPSAGERGFHIFYQLIVSKFAKSMKLESAEHYNYLSCSQCYRVDGMNDSTEFEETISALHSVGFLDADIQSIMSIVASILHLGNIEFSAMSGAGNADGSCISDNNTALKNFADLLKLDASKVSYVLTHREIQTTHGGQTESVFSPQNPLQASERRDALARSMYEQLFNMIVARINRELEIDSKKVDQSFLVSIGVLDIYGFEIFDKNYFEQLCINYVNEKLQQIFIELTLRAEQDEYEREGIQWTPIPFFNNRIVCELLDGSSPPGLFRILDDVCKNPFIKADSEIDQKMLLSANTTHGNHAHFASQNSSKTTNPSIISFTIRHYAGDVDYQVGKLGETNKDSLKSDLVNMIKASGENMISTGLYNTNVVEEMKSTITAATRIRTQCQALVDTLMECAPHYVRCVKSNDDKKALTIDPSRVLHQVKYLGLAENIKVRRAGFAYRCEYNRFLDRFYLLSPQTFPDWKGSDADGCRAIMKSCSTSISSIKGGEVQYGKTIIFIRSPETFHALSQLRKARITEIPIPIQRAWRRYLLKVEVNKLPAIMGDLYSKNSKARNRQSLFRDYSSSYLENLGLEYAEEVKAGIFRIVDYYNKDENIKFIDHECVEIVKSNVTPFWSKPLRMLILTTEAVYIMEILGGTESKKIHPKKNIPQIILRRRIGFKPSVNRNTHGKDIADGILENIQISTLADGCLCFKMKPVIKIMDPKKDLFILHPNWPKKESVNLCQKTKEPFGFLFDRKKRCKVTGMILREAVCDIMQRTPDYGYYEPKRINDDVVGLMSCDQVEDVVLVSFKKTEFLALLLIEWETLFKNRNIVSFQQNNKFTLRAGPNVETTRTVAAEITIQADKLIIDDHALVGAVQFSAASPPNVKPPVPITRENFILKVCCGILESVVNARAKRQVAKAAQAIIDRKRKDEERKVRNAQREVDAEKNRLLRQKEKFAAGAARRAEHTPAKTSNRSATTTAALNAIASQGSQKKELNSVFNKVTAK